MLEVLLQDLRVYEVCGGVTDALVARSGAAAAYAEIPHEGSRLAVPPLAVMYVHVNQLLNQVHDEETHAGEQWRQEKVELAHSALPCKGRLTSILAGQSYNSPMSMGRLGRVPIGRPG